MKDLLKEAIADAKAVRETALANAKLALEEAFTPRLQSMLSTQLEIQKETLENYQQTAQQLEIELVSARKKKRAVLHNLRAKIGDMKTQEWVAQRSSDKMFKDMLECEC